MHHNQLSLLTFVEQSLSKSENLLASAGSLFPRVIHGGDSSNEFLFLNIFDINCQYFLFLF